MRTHRNSRGQVKAPTYSEWASYELGMGMTAIFLAVSIRAMQQQFGLNDWQTREVLRKWAEESTRKATGGESGGST